MIRFCFYAVMIRVLAMGGRFCAVGIAVTARRLVATARRLVVVAKKLVVAAKKLVATVRTLVVAAKKKGAPAAVSECAYDMKKLTVGCFLLCLLISYRAAMRRGMSRAATGGRGLPRPWC